MMILVPSSVLLLDACCCCCMSPVNAHYTCQGYDRLRSNYMVLSCLK